MSVSPSSSRGTASVLLSATVSPTNAQILAMHTAGGGTVPVTVVPAASGVRYALIGAAWSSVIVDAYTPNEWLAVATSAGAPAAEYLLDQLWIEADTPPHYKPIAVNTYDLTDDLVIGAAEITGGGNAANRVTVTVYYLAVTPILA